MSRGQRMQQSRYVGRPKYRAAYIVASGIMLIDGDSANTMPSPPIHMAARGFVMSKIWTASASVSITPSGDA